MTYEKHTTHTDALDTLGSVIDETQKRDAIHLAVEPAVAGMPLAPGQHVRFDDKGEAITADTGKGVGIVDPFLTDVVYRGDRFWLVVYPRQISSLRHVWEHPSFPPSGETKVIDTIISGNTFGGIAQIDPAKQAAEQWIRAWLETTELSQFQFEDVMLALETGRGGGYPELVYSQGDLYLYGTDGYGNIPNEFWNMAEIYLGQRFTDRPESFSCSC